MFFILLVGFTGIAAGFCLGNCYLLIKLDDQPFDNEKYEREIDEKLSYAKRGKKK